MFEFLTKLLHLCWSSRFFDIGNNYIWNLEFINLKKFIEFSYKGALKKLQLQQFGEMLIKYTIQRKYQFIAFRLQFFLLFQSYFFTKRFRIQKNQEKIWKLNEQFFTYYFVNYETFRINIKLFYQFVFCNQFFIVPHSSKVINKINIMYRVILRVNKVCLRIKQNVQIQLAIKKQNESIILNQKSKLNNCQAFFYNQTEFYISCNDPSFGIYIMIGLSNSKKLAGIFNVNLIKYQQNSNNYVQERLQKSPDSEACIVFEFLYITTSYKSGERNLISIEQLQDESRKEISKQMQKNNDHLVQENTKLDLELQKLRLNNKNLIFDKQQLSDYHQESLKLYELRYQQKKQEAENSQNNMKIMKDKMERLRNLVGEHGNQGMKERVQEFFQKQ